MPHDGASSSVYSACAAIPATACAPVPKAGAQPTRTRTPHNSSKSQATGAAVIPLCASGALRSHALNSGPAGPLRSAEWPADNPHGDLFIRPAPHIPRQVFSTGSQHGCGAASCLSINSGAPFEFESELFVGKLYIWVRGLPSTPAGIFAKGMKRQIWIVIQGRFKQPVGFDELEFGSDFPGPLRLPLPGVVRW